MEGGHRELNQVERSCVVGGAAMPRVYDVLQTQLRHEVEQQCDARMKGFGHGLKQMNPDAPVESVNAFGRSEQVRVSRAGAMPREIQAGSCDVRNGPGIGRATRRVDGNACRAKAQSTVSLGRRSRFHAASGDFGHRRAAGVAAAYE